LRTEFKVLIEGEGKNPNPSGPRAKRPFPLSPPPIRDRPWAGLNRDIPGFCATSPHLSYRAQGLPQRRGFSPRSVIVCRVRFYNDGEGENPNPSGPRAKRPFPLPPPPIRDSPSAELHRDTNRHLLLPSTGLSRSGDATAAGRQPQEWNRIWSAVVYNYYRILLGRRPGKENLVNQKMITTYIEERLSESPRYHSQNRSGRVVPRSNQRQPPSV